MNFIRNLFKTSWEYKIVPFTDYIDTRSFELRLNEYGKKGWEIFRIKDKSPSTQIIYLKRKL